MPDDDGSIVEIKQEVFFRDATGVIKELILVCNKTNAAVTVDVTTHPYSAPGTKMAGGEQSQTVTIPANMCIPVVFTIPAVPTQCYTDVWPGNQFIRRNRYHYSVKSLGRNPVITLPPPGPPAPPVPGGVAPVGSPTSTGTVAPVGSPTPAGAPSGPAPGGTGQRLQRSFRLSLPYPRSLESTGKPLRFEVRGVRGLPAGWRTERTWPRIGKSITLQPDEREATVLLAVEIDPGAPAPRGLVVVDIDVGVRGRPFRPPYTVPLQIELLGETPAARLVSWRSRREKARPTYVQFEAVVEQPHGLWDAPIVRFSKDRGASWRDVPMFFDRVERPATGATPLSRARFTLSLPTAGRSETMLASGIARDQLGREHHTAIEKHPLR